MNVLQLTLSFTHGGRRQAIKTLVEGLTRHDVPCHLGCLDARDCSYDGVDDWASKVVALERDSLLDVRALGRLRSLCRRRRIDVIHAHDAASQFTGAIVRLALPRVRLLMTFHRSLAFESATWRDRLRNAFACAQSSAVVTGSRERRRHFIEQNRVSPRKVVRIPFGIDTNRFQPLEEDRRALRRELGFGSDDVVLGAAGHFGEEKGIDVVVEAFTALVQRRPKLPIRLVVLGEGTPQRQQIIQSLTDTFSNEQVRFLGFRPDVERWFRAFDLFLHAPRSEAFGLVLAEAMATALPVVATRVGGIPDLVRDGLTGSLVPSESPLAFADAIEKLVADRAAREAMARTARRVAVEEFSAEVYAKRYLQLYRDLMARRVPRGVDEKPPQGDLPFEVRREQELDPSQSESFSTSNRNELTPRGVL